MVTAYCQKIRYEDKEMMVSIVGDGEKTIVFLPGLGSPSPIIEFKALASFLQNKYKVVTVDYLGYGLSSKPDTKRNLENISNELHECLRALKCERYILAAHSISGIYCLYYINKYPEEVEAFVGIDSSVPQQEQKQELTEKNLKFLLKRKKKANSKLFCWKVRTSAKIMLMAASKDYQYSNEDIEMYAKLSVEGLNSNVPIDKLTFSSKDLESLQHIRFPNNIPILFLLASRTVKQIPEWYRWHEELLTSNNGCIIQIDGIHYLHLVQPQIIAGEMEKFIATMKNE